MTLASIPFVPRTKFRPPRLPDDVLLRTRLLERLDRDATLTLIIARRLRQDHAGGHVAGTLQPPRHLVFARRRRQHAAGLSAKICHWPCAACFRHLATRFSACLPRRLS